MSLENKIYDVNETYDLALTSVDALFQGDQTDSSDVIQHHNVKLNV